MNSDDLKKVLKSVECCSETDVDDPCAECPYKESNDNNWSCIDERCEDLKKILDWGIETMETLEHFLKR